MNSKANRQALRHAKIRARAQHLATMRQQYRFVVSKMQSDSARGATVQDRDKMMALTLGSQIGSPKAMKWGVKARDL